MTELETKWERFAVPTMVQVPGIEDPQLRKVYWAFAVAPRSMKAFPFPVEAQELIYGEDIGATLGTVSLIVQDIPETDTFAFSLSANYKINPLPKGRTLWTTVEDVEQWWTYVQAILGIEIEDLLTLAEFLALPKPEDA
jgi:hypothetical protein